MHFLTAPSLSLFSPHLIPSLFPSFGPNGRVRRFALLNDPGSVFVCVDSFKKGNCYWSCSRFLRRCKDSEGELSSLESQILEFMQNSDKPEAFPTKEELVAAGRVDLVHAIADEGGWLAFGWDLNDGSSEIHDFEDKGGKEIDGNETRASGVSSSPSQPAKSLEIEAEESGIEGILNRLEKQRNSSFGLGLREKEGNVSFENNEDKDEWDHRATADAVAAHLDNSSSSLSPTSNHLSGSQIKHDLHSSHLGTDNLRNSLKPEMWRNWIIQRNGSSDADFEDAEIVPGETQKGGVTDVSGRSDILNGREFSCETINKETGLYSVDGNANHNDIKSRIQYLESELSSVLNSLRSSSDIVKMQTGQESSSDDLAKLSDAWEFQENEIMNAQDRLRSIRAKLAVLEGKMALAIMDAHKVVQEKQKKINNAQKALQILKTTSVVWPSNASEVLLTGSFDGWSTKRKMEKSSTGIFSVCLQLYPGKYEIKFIVDGEWKIDPLRPVVHNNGYDNNLLIIHD
ncbi:protein PTST homolog 2, chloroplastic [Abrus precatorius]|uniref:Protein PTST homolog 2, chloroplastic n=1 Tax=Abrus precatorius TaxID=3816 RepID=A0A8B8M0H1_ABRPR|nr:protein PTST homolog 2, chloroplastic [Abrus precatorius]